MLNYGCLMESGRLNVMGRQDDLQQSVSSAVMQWLGSAAARPYQNSALQQLASVIPRVLGYRLLQIGGWPLQLDALGRSAMLHHWVLGGQASQDVTLPVDVCGEMSHLPIASQSVDAVLLPHCLSKHRIHMHYYARSTGCFVRAARSLFSALTR